MNEKEWQEHEEALYRAREERRANHDAKYIDVLLSLESLGIVPKRLKEYLAGLDD